MTKPALTANMAVHLGRLHETEALPLSPRMGAVLCRQGLAAIAREGKDGAYPRFLITKRGKRALDAFNAPPPQTGGGALVRRSMARTDVHRPAEMNPRDYEVLAIGYRDVGEDIEGNVACYLVLEEASPRWAEIGRPEEGTWKGRRLGRCDHCGARVKYYCVVEHRPTGDLIEVGVTCVERFMGRRYDHAQRLLKAKALRLSRIRKLFSSQAGLEEAVGLVLDGANRAWDGAVDMARRFMEKGELSDRQLPLLMRERDKLLRRREEREAALLTAKPLAHGRRKCRGVVGSLKDDAVYERLSYRGAPALVGYRYKGVVHLGDGTKVWGPLPRALHPREHDGLVKEAGVAVGDEVEFTADVSPSGDDPLFGFFKNPRGFVRLSAAPQTGEGALA